MKKDKKYRYDRILKDDYIEKDNDRKKLFGYKIDFTYDNYFNKDEISKIQEQLGKHYEEYKRGGGQELKALDLRPPKFLSIGSSSNFCFFSLKDDGYKYFIKAIEGFDFNIKESIKFETKLNIIPKAYSNMDAYFKTDKNEYFVECKCHEFFDTHGKSLSKSYFKKEYNLFVLKDEFKQWFYKDGKIRFGVGGIGIEENSGFDFKQFCTHLMAIDKNRDKSLTTHFIYYFCLPKEESLKKDKELYDKICQTIKDSQTILNNPKLKEYFNGKIEFHLFVKYDGYTKESASEKNTKKYF